MPAAMSSRASVSRVARVFEGDKARTVCMCRRTRALRSSLHIVRPCAPYNHAISVHGYTQWLLIEEGQNMYM